MIDNNRFNLLIKSKDTLYADFNNFILIVNKIFIVINNISTIANTNTL